MKNLSKYVGPDVHKQAIAVAVAYDNSGELRFIGEILNTPQASNKLITQPGRASAALSFCHEAGPCGYNIHRQLRQLDLG
jgi:transposase